MNTHTRIKPEELASNPFTLIGTDWMLVTAAREGRINTMTASWGGLGVMWGKNVVYVVLRPQRYTKEFVDHAEGFSLSFFNRDYKKTLGYLGKVSGRDEDKIAQSGLTPADEAGIPYFGEADTVILCKKLFAQPYLEESFIQRDIIDKWYPERDYHTLYIAEVTDVLVRQA